jgi:hypothetical protein
MATRRIRTPLTSRQSMSPSPSSTTLDNRSGYPAVLVKLAEIDVADLEDLVTEARLTQAPKKLVQEFLASTEPKVDDPL